MTFPEPAIAVINYIAITLGLIQMFFYFRLKKNSWAAKAFGLALHLVAIPWWPRLGRVPTPELTLLLTVLFFFYVAVVLHLFVFEGTFSRILFGVVSVGSGINLSIIIIYSALADGLGLSPCPMTFTLARLIFIGLCLGLYPLLYRHARRPFIRILDAIENEKWYFSSLTTLMFFILSYLGLMFSFLQPGVVGVVTGIMPAMALAGFHVMLYNLIINRDQNCLLASNLKSSRLLLQMYDHFNEEQARKEEAFRLMRHDFRHRLGHMEDLAESGDTESLRRYLEKMVEDLDRCVVRTYSEDRAVNAVVSYYFARAAKNGTHCEAQISGPEQSPLNELETASLIGNALENCVKGAAPLGDQGQIAFRLKPVKDRLVFKFENTYQEGQYHQGEGLGLKSLRLICARHRGLMECTAADGWFRLVVILPRRDSESEKEGK